MSQLLGYPWTPCEIANHTRGQLKFSGRTQHRPTGPFSDIKSIGGGKLIVILSGSAESSSAVRSWYQIPLRRAERYAIEITKNGSEVWPWPIGMASEKHVSRVRVGMYYAARKIPINISEFLLPLIALNSQPFDELAGGDAQFRRRPSRKLRRRCGGKRFRLVDTFPKFRYRIPDCEMAR
jgi:hypothetical protein